jgi:hypothetical protein
MLLGHPWLKDAKVFRDWGNNNIIIQGVDIVRTIHGTKKLGAPTKRPEIFVCYDLHSSIFDKEKDLMFAIERGLFSRGSIGVPTSVWSNQLVKLITSTSFNLVKQVNKHVEHVSKPLVLSNICVKSVPV